jgi:hypothetical protein
MGDFTNLQAGFLKKIEFLKKNTVDLFAKKIFI